MKKILLPVAALTMIIVATLLTSCTQEDTTAPVITIVGNNPYTVTLGTSYTDEGATANDDKDGDLTTSIVSNASSSNPNVNLTGTYTINYTVSDAAGNTASKTRTVYVKNSLDNYTGSYAATDDWNSDGTVDFTWTETITASSSVNNQLVFSKFAYYTGCSLKVNVSGTSLSYPGTQTFLCGAGTEQQNRTFTILSGTTTGTLITITYHEVDADLFETTGVDTFTKQ